MRVAPLATLHPDQPPPALWSRTVSERGEAPEPIDVPLTSGEDVEGSVGWRAWVIASVMAALAVVGGIVVMGQVGSDGSDAQADAAARASSGDAGIDDAASADRGFGGGVVGTLTEIDGDSFVIEGADRAGETTMTRVTTTEDTTFTRTEAGGVAEIDVGDNVVVSGETADDGAIDATAIADRGSLDVAVAGGGGARPGPQPPGGGGLPEDVEPPAGFEPPGDGQLPADLEPPAGFEPPAGASPGGGGRPTVGQVIEVDGMTLTVETNDGETVTVLMRDDTEVTVTVEASIEDLEVGEEVQVVRAESSGDDVVAESVQIGAAGFGGFGPGGPARPPEGN